MPYSERDIECAINAAIGSGHSIQWAAEQVFELIDESGRVVNDIDPVGCVYQAIFQEVREEMFLIIGTDLALYVENSENYHCTEFDFSKKELNEVIVLLAGNKVILERLSKPTQWFFSEIGIFQENISARAK